MQEKIKNMKNIHILPTDKPSRLFIYNGDLGFAKGFQYGSDAILNQHIYITSDEEIKEGDWILNETHNIEKAISHYNYKSLSSDCKKIILTTDQDLIKDGVQAIDDEFLEWFVKNPNCEGVEVKFIKDGWCLKEAKEVSFYKTIIPKEEDCSCTDECLGYLTKSCKRIEEPKQETLEEAAINYANYNVQIHNAIKEAVKFGAKWQAERMYSEEEVLAMLLIKHDGLSPEYVLEQFKNK